jgi:hypothetical protein
LLEPPFVSHWQDFCEGSADDVFVLHVWFRSCKLMSDGDRKKVASRGLYNEIMNTSACMSVLYLPTPIVWTCMAGGDFSACSPGFRCGGGVQDPQARCRPLLQLYASPMADIGFERLSTRWPMGFHDSRSTVSPNDGRYRLPQSTSRRTNPMASSIGVEYALSRTLCTLLMWEEIRRGDSPADANPVLLHTSIL